MKYHSTIGIRQNTNKMGKKRRNQQLIVAELTQKNSELYHSLTKVEKHFEELESKLFETSARTGHAELRAGRAELRAAEASERAGHTEEKVALIEERSILVEERSVLTEERAALAEERSVLAEERAALGEGRVMQLEEKWMKVTGVIKIPFRVMRWVVSLPKQLFKKRDAEVRTVSSPEHVEEVERRVPDSDSTNITPCHNDKSISPSPHTQSIYQNLKTTQINQEDTEKCV